MLLDPTRAMLGIDFLRVLKKPCLLSLQKPRKGKPSQAENVKAGGAEAEAAVRKRVIWWRKNRYKCDLGAGVESWRRRARLLLLLARRRRRRLSPSRKLNLSFVAVKGAICASLA